MERRNQLNARLAADLLYTYDDLAGLAQAGLDVNLNGSLDAGGSDRIIVSDRSIVHDGSHWWSKLTTSTYPVSSSSSLKLLSSSRERLTGLGGSNLIGHHVDEDEYGNLTDIQTFLSPSTHTTTVKTTYPGIYYVEELALINGLAVSAKGVDNHTRLTGYDALWRRSTQQDSRNGNTTTTLYQAGTELVASVKDANNQVVTSYGYDGAGRCTSETHAMLGKATYTSYTLRDQVYRRWGDTTYPVENEYNDFGQRTKLRTYRGGSGWNSSTWPASPGTADETTWTYDATSNLLTSVTDASSETTTFDYTTLGKLSQRTQPNGKGVAYAYDGNTAELTSVTYNDSTPSLGYTYTRAGKLESVTDATGTRDFIYNSTYPLQLDAEALDATYYSSRVLTRLYDGSTGISGSPNYGPYYASGRLGRPAGLQLGVIGDADRDLYEQHTRHRDGRFVGVNRRNGPGSADDFLYSYLADSHLVESYQMFVFTHQYTYENQRDLPTGVTNSWFGGTVADYAYTYNLEGQRSASVASGSAVSSASFHLHSYNDRGELTASPGYLGTNTANTSSPYANRNFAYGYDTIGNRTQSNYNGTGGSTHAYGSNALNQISSFSSPVAATVTPSYDDSGNTTADGVWSYTYDGENRVKEMEDGAGLKLVFAYDYLGRRVRKQVYSGVTKTFDRKYIYDGWNMIAETDEATGHVVRSYTWGLDQSGTLKGAGGAGGLLQTTTYAYSGSTITGITNYLSVADGQGNITALVRGDGTLAQAFEYSPFGEVLRSQNYDSAVADFPLGFASQMTDSETGLVNFAYRLYAPKWGRFIQRDPIGVAGGQTCTRTVGTIA